MALSLDGNILTINLQVGSTETESPPTTGPDLSTALEQFANAFLLSAGSVEIPFSGPDVGGIGLEQDSTEPYTWENNVGFSFYGLDDYAALSQAQKNATTLTMDDGLPDLPDASAPGAVTLNAPPTDSTEGFSVNLTDSAWRVARRPTTLWPAPTRSSVVSGPLNTSRAGIQPRRSQPIPGVTVRITVTATGDGTTAADGTSDTATDDVIFTVLNVSGKLAAVARPTMPYRRRSPRQLDV